MSDLAPGTRIGDYEILGAIGAGGMGQVYRARDVSLRREVALKVLPADFAADLEWRRRFEREARLLASLSHPNLAVVHRFEADHPPPFLVMELVPGDTLAGRLARGPLPVGDALVVLRQIAAGLEAAHDAGIVHRDLKPANVKITPDGVVKVLDFGLARSLHEDTAHGATEPTVTALHTREGSVMGTAPYMSPEQAQGKATDRRSDLWAFGCVAYELLCGRRAFPGENTADTLAAVLRAEPDWSALPPEVPPRLVDLVRRCLQKDPARRLRDARDVRLAIEDLQSASSPPAAAPAGLSSIAATSVRQRPSTRTVALAWTFAALGLAAAAVFWWLGHRLAAASSQWQQFVQLTDQAGVEDDPVVSPDGTSIAYARQNGRSWDVYVQRVGGHNPIVVAGDASRDERGPAFSPDGTLIAFHESDADGGIFVVGSTGESARRLTDFGFHPTWSPDGAEIAFCTEETALPTARFTKSSLWVVSVRGGAPTKIFDGDAVQPAWSPSGARIAFMAVVRTSQRNLFTIPARGGTPVPVTDDAFLDLNPTWTPDGRALYFASDRGGVMNLWRVAIDENSGRSLGALEPVTNGVVASADEPSLSKNGSRLVFRSRVESANPAVVPMDPVAGTFGEPKPLFQRTGILVTIDVSRDGQWLALSNQGEAQEDVFISRVDGTGFRRLTDDVFRDRSPTWSPDGRRVAFYSNRGDRGLQIWTVKIDGSGLTQISDVDSGDANFPLFSPDNRIVATMLLQRKVAVFDLSKPLPIRTPEFLPDTDIGDGWFAAKHFSPNGRRIAGWILGASGQVQGLGVYDLSTHKAAKIADSNRRNFLAAWLDDRRLMYGVNDRVVVLDVESGQHREFPGSDLISTFGVALAPGGRALYLTSWRAEADVWMAQGK